MFTSHNTSHIKSHNVTVLMHRGRSRLLSPGGDAVVGNTGGD